MTTKPTPSLDDLLVAYEKIVIVETLRRNDWNRSRTAAALKITRRRLYRRLEALNFVLEAAPQGEPREKK